MVWRRRRRVGKTRQLIRFISFILILASLTSNNHTRMVFVNVMSTSFADKLCPHISIPAAYMTASSLSWYRLIVFRALHGVSSVSETNPHITIAILMFLGSIGILYHCVTNGVSRSCAILSKNSFLFNVFSGWSFRMLCACMTNAFTAAMLIMP